MLSMLTSQREHHISYFQCSSLQMFHDKEHCALLFLQCIIIKPFHYLQVLLMYPLQSPPGFDILEWSSKHPLKYIRGSSLQSLTCMNLPGRLNSEAQYRVVSINAMNIQNCCSQMKYFQIFTSATDNSRVKIKVTSAGCLVF